MKTYRGELNGKGKRIAIVASRFNEIIVDNLVKAAIGELKRLNVNDDDIVLYSCPGAFEIPQVADMLAQKKMADAIICLGAVIRGATAHFEYVSGQCASGIMQVALTHHLPVIFGVLTTDNIEQAMERAGNNSDNKGIEAATTAVDMLTLSSQF